MSIAQLCRAAIVLLVALLPWFFGGVAPTYRLAASAVTLACLAATLLFAFRSTAAAWGAVRLPLAMLFGAFALGVVQLSPSVAELAAGVDPTPSEIRRHFAASPDDGVIAAQPISLHPPSTRRNLASLAMAGAAFAIGAALFAETGPLLLLMSSAALVGAAVALFGLVQRLTWNGLIYWSEPTFGGQPFGPFINRNNAGGFLEVTLAAAIGLLLWRLLAIPQLTETRRSHRPFGVAPTPGRRAAWLLANLNVTILAAAAAVLVISAGVLDSLSRGSFVAMTVGSASGLAIVALASRRTSYAWLLAAVVAAGLALTGWLGEHDALFERLATLGDPEQMQNESRLDHWHTSLQAAHDFWLTGAGLGAYRYAYTRYQHGPTSLKYLYAENQYLDALVSAGAIGLALFVAMILLFGLVVLRLLRRAESAADFGVAAAAAVLLTTQVLHSAFDFASYVPAHFVLFALLTGAMWRRANRTAGAGDRNAPAPSVFGRITAIACGLSLLTALACGMRELRIADICRRAEAATRLVDGAHQRDTAWFDEALRIQSRAVDSCPDDGEARTRLAELWTGRYRAEFLRNLGNLPPNATMLLWSRPERLYADAHLAARTWNDDAVQALRDNPLVAENLAPALTEARRARAACPLSPFPLLLTAKLCFIDESPLNDLFYLDRLEELIDGREPWLFEIGALHLDAARTERAFAAWRRCLELSSAHEERIIQYAAGYLTPPQMLERLLPDSPQIIARIARTELTGDRNRRDRELFLRRALEISVGQTSPSPADEFLQGTIEVELGLPAAGAATLERAASRAPEKTAWLYEAAEAHAFAGNWRRARELALECVRREPGDERYTSLLHRINGKLATIDTNDRSRRDQP